MDLTPANLTLAGAMGVAVVALWRALVAIQARHSGDLIERLERECARCEAAKAEIIRVQELRIAESREYVAMASRTAVALDRSMDVLTRAADVLEQACAPLEALRRQVLE